MSISVLGAGAFGTALAISLAARTHVTLWARSAEHAGDMSRECCNRLRLPGVALPDTVHPTADLAAACASDVLLLAIPMQQLRTVLAENTALLTGRTLVACCKGIELGTGLGPVRLIDQIVPQSQSAILTGPSFADEIAKGLPTALTLACANEDHSKTLQETLTTDTIRLYRTTDTVGAELGGALKNVVAIACGAVIGAGLGNSARAALMTRGYAEMQRMALAMGAKQQTLAGLSGFGDLTLTCGSEQSRNFRYGMALGRDDTFDTDTTVEGVATARAVVAQAGSIGLDLPIAQAVVGLVEQSLTLTQAVDQLLTRPLKEE